VLSALIEHAIQGNTETVIMKNLPALILALRLLKMRRSTAWMSEVVTRRNRCSDVQPSDQAWRTAMKTTCFVAVLSVFAALPARSKADPIVVFNDFGFSPVNGESYSSGYWFVNNANGIDGIFATPHEESVAFTPSTTVTLDTVFFAVTSLFGEDEMYLSLSQDAGGHPSATQIQIGGAIAIPNLPAGEVYETAGAFGPPFGPPAPVLTAGETYWITASAILVDGVGWFEGSTGG
jgi:hypothetical protein